MSEGTPCPDPDASGAPGPAEPARDRAVSLAPPFLGGPEQDEILDWELASLPNEDDPSEAYPDEDEPEAGDEDWLDEISYVLACPDEPVTDGLGPVSARPWGTAHHHLP